jgi:ankyrin repeat protein
LNKRVVSLLLTKGANPNLLNRETESQFSVALSGAATLIGNGITPLREANDNVFFGILELLISHGGDINYQDENGKTFLMTAAELDRADYVEFLLRKGAKKELLDKQGHNAQNYAEKMDTELATMLIP